jgi:hypothetical protein
MLITTALKRSHALVPIIPRIARHGEGKARSDTCELGCHEHLKVKISTMGRIRLPSHCQGFGQGYACLVWLAVNEDGYGALLNSWPLKKKKKKSLTSRRKSLPIPLLGLRFTVRRSGGQVDLSMVLSHGHGQPLNLQSSCLPCLLLAGRPMDEVLGPGFPWWCGSVGTIVDSHMRIREQSALIKLARPHGVS